VKIYAAAAGVEALRKKERGGQNRMKLSFYHKKIGAFLSFTPPLKANILFAGTKLRVLVLCFLNFTESSLESSISPPPLRACKTSGCKHKSYERNMVTIHSAVDMPKECF
jgi:hypothetical protein